MKKISIKILSKTVELEDGRRSFVDIFSISRRCISVYEFSNFQNESGYITDAERAGGENYKENYLTSGLVCDGQSLDECDAIYISPNDADAYCKYFGLRLPTEFELFSSLVENLNTYDSSRGIYPEYCNQRGVVSRSTLADLKTIITYGGREITSDFENNLSRVVRGGPYLFLDYNWRSLESKNRQWLKMDEFGIDTCFRCVLPKSA